MYPFYLQDSVFSELVFRRQPQVPDDLHLQLKATTHLHSQTLPERIEIQLRLETIEEGPLTFAIELIGLFSVQANDGEVTREDAQRFLAERGFYILFPMIRQKISEMNHIMGVRRLDLPMMTFDEFSPDDVDSDNHDEDVETTSTT